MSEGTHDTPLDRLLPRLEAVKPAGPSRWSARCPAHPDRTPSLSIRETDDGILLIKCWAGCGAAEIVEAIGLELRDLFPQPLNTSRAPFRPGQRWLPKDVLEAVAHEALLVMVVAEDVHQGLLPTETDMNRLALAARRLRAAAREVGCNV